jgi:hypothetical protein
MLIADLRSVNQDTTHSKLISVFKNLNAAWDPKDIMPPYIDTIANFFPANVMKKSSMLSSAPAVNKTHPSSARPRK